MPRDFFDPTPEQQNVVLINAAILREAERLIESCEHCNPEGAEIPFDNILDRVTGSDPSVTDYILESPAKSVRTAGVTFSKRRWWSLTDLRAGPLRVASTKAGLTIQPGKEGQTAIALQPASKVW